jgi:hypothetical protein
MMIRNEPTPPFFFDHHYKSILLNHQIHVIYDPTFHNLKFIRLKAYWAGDEFKSEPFSLVAAKH